jgi:hypothetical protein
MASNEETEFREASESSEDESDLGVVEKLDISSVAVSGTDWTTETVLSQLKKGNIELNPKFQRRDAWEPKRKSAFIESLILGLPIPPIVLAERQDYRGKYIVLDGKQRLLCLRRFTAEDSDQEFENFALSDLTIRKDLIGRTFKELSEDLQFQTDITSFENQPIRTVVLRRWTSEELLFHVFLRLNTGSKPLSPQELRQALHPGPFLNFADEVSTDSKAIRSVFGTTKPDFRMRDVELVIRYFAFRNCLAIYRGNMKAFLDTVCEKFNKEWRSLQPVLETQLREMEESHWLIGEVFPKRYNYGKWNGSRFEGRFNRAIFDILHWTFPDPGVRAICRSDPGKIVEAFKDICVGDPKFLEAIERTTKSLDSTQYRFEAWINLLNIRFNLSISAPQIGSSL